MELRVVVRVGNAQPFIEAVALRMKLRARAEVPLAEARRRVAAFFEHLRQQPFIGMQSIAAGVVESALQADAVRITAREQRCARRRADRLRNIEAGEARPFRRHPVEMRRLEPARALAAHVRIPHVIRDDENDIRQALGGVERGQRSQQQRSEGEEVFHAAPCAYCCVKTNTPFLLATMTSGLPSLLRSPVVTCVPTPLSSSMRCGMNSAPPLPSRLSWNQ